MDEIKIIKVGVVYQLYLNRQYNGTFSTLMDAVKWVEKHAAIKSDTNMG